MAHVQDVAEYILRKQGTMSAMKLQKLVYYAQAWALVWDEERLFPESIEAWANGPVAPALYRRHRGKFKVEPGDVGGDTDVLSKRQRETINAVIRYYGKKAAHWLSELTHRERPWKTAREGLAPGVRSSNEITHAAMAEYYGSL